MYIYITSSNDQTSFSVIDTKDSVVDVLDVEDIKFALENNLKIDGLSLENGAVNVKGSKFVQKLTDDEFDLVKDKYQIKEVKPAGVYDSYYVSTDFDSINKEIEQSKNKDAMNRLDLLADNMISYLEELDIIVDKRNKEIPDVFNECMENICDYCADSESKALWERLGFTDEEMAKLGIETEEDEYFSEDSIDYDIDEEEELDDYDDFDDELDEEDDIEEFEDDEEDAFFDDGIEDLIPDFSYRLNNNYYYEDSVLDVKNGNVEIGSNILYDKYLTSEQIALLQKYYMLLSQYVFKLDMSQSTLTGAKKKAFDALGRDASHQWVYAGMVDMGYAGTRVCGTCGALARSYGVSSCCHRPIVNFTKKVDDIVRNKDLWHYAPVKDEDGTIRGTYRRTINGKCIRCGKHCSVVRTDVGKKNVDRSNESGLYCEACHNEIIQSNHYCTMNHPTRYIHVAWDVSKAPLEEHFNGVLLNSKIESLIESDNAIKFGLDCVADFFNIGKDSESFKALKKIQEICSKDMQEMTDIYECKKYVSLDKELRIKLDGEDFAQGLDFKDAPEHLLTVEEVNDSLKLLDTIAPKIKTASVKFALMKEDKFLPTKMITLYMDMRQSGMLIPRSFVKFIRDFLIGWVWTMDKFKATEKGLSESVFSITGSYISGESKLFSLGIVDKTMTGLFGVGRTYKYIDIFKHFTISSYLEVRNSFATCIKEDYIKETAGQGYRALCYGDAYPNSFRERYINKLFGLYFTKFLVYNICGIYRYSPYSTFNDEGGSNKVSRERFYYCENKLEVLAKLFRHEFTYTYDEAIQVIKFLTNYYAISGIVDKFIGLYDDGSNDDVSFEFSRHRQDKEYTSMDNAQEAVNRVLGNKRAYTIFYGRSKCRAVYSEDKYITFDELVNNQVILTIEQLKSAIEEISKEREEEKRLKAEEEERKRQEEERKMLEERERRILMAEERRVEKERQEEERKKREEDKINKSDKELVNNLDNITGLEKATLVKNNKDKLPDKGVIGFAKNIVDGICTRNREPSQKQMIYIDAAIDYLYRGKKVADINKEVKSKKSNRTSLTSNQMNILKDMVVTSDFFLDSREKDIIEDIYKNKGYTERELKYLEEVMKRWQNTSI